MTDHRILRAKERYGVDLTLRDIATLEAALSPANRFKAHGHDVIHLVRHAGVAMLAAVKDIAGKRIITTFLPHDAFSSRRLREHRRTRA